MIVFIEKTNKELKIKFEGDVKTLLKKININAEEIIVVRGNELLNDDEILSDKDSIKLLSVVSGG